MSCGVNALVVQEVQLDGEKILRDVGFIGARRIETMKLSLKFDKVSFYQFCRAENLVKQVPPAPKFLMDFNQPRRRSCREIGSVGGRRCDRC